MTSDASSPTRDRTAVASSIALHLCVLALLAAVGNTAPAFPLDVPDERTLLSSVVRIERAPGRPAAAPHGPAARPRIARALPAVSVAHTTEHARRAMIVANERRYHDPAPAAAAARTRGVDAPAPPQPSVARAAVVAQTTAETPQPRSEGSPAPAEHEIGVGGFGEDQDAAAIPAMVAGLRAKVSAHATVRIAIDEHGHATNVAFVAGADDPAVRAELLRELLAASYIAAVCHGLPCAGTVVFSL